MSRPPLVRLNRLAAVRPSSVDKLTVPGEDPVRLCNYTDVYSGDTITLERPFMEASATPGEIERFELRRDDVLMTKDSETADDIGVAAWVREDLSGVLLGYHTALIRPHSSVNGRFLYWVLQSAPVQNYFERAARGVTRCGLRQEDIAHLPVPLLELPEQRRIADYLDSETGRIDSIIGRNAKMLSLLDERSTALRTQLMLDHVPTDDPFAVLGGHLPGLPRVKNLVLDRFAGRTPKEGPHWTSPDDAEGVAWLGVGDFEHGSTVSLASRYLRRRDLPGLGLRTMPAGTVVFAMYGATAGKVARTGIVATWNQAVLGLEPDPSRVEPDYFFLWLALAGPLARALARSNTQDNFNAEQVLNFSVPAASREQQKHAVAQIRLATERTAVTASRLQHQSELLRERRQALITAAVTGQLDAWETA